jgi:hypothetical protein
MPMMAEDFVNATSFKSGLIMSLEKHCLQIGLQVLSDILSGIPPVLN